MSALVPSAKNDEFASPDSELYILSVPFSADNKNVINFANKTAQINAFIDYMSDKPHFHRTGLNIIRKDHSIYLREPFAKLAQEGYDIYQFNYLIYKNPALDNKWWFCFITNVEYQAKDVTKIDFVVDVWQTFHTDITYRKCMVERCHIPSGEDSFRLWNEPEPLNVIPYGESDNLNTVTVGGWVPRAIAICQAVPDGGTTTDFWGNANQPHFVYGNSGNRESHFMENSAILYGLDLSSSSNWGTAYNQLLNTYNKAFGDHRNDIQYLQILPYFIYRQINFTVIGGQESGLKGLESNVGYSEIVATFNMNDNTIAPNDINYTPRNKKLLSSLCRSFIIFNKSGFTLFIKPEDITAPNNNRFQIKATGKPLGLKMLKLSTTDLRTKSNSFWYIPYNYTVSLAYNENEGATQEIKQMQAGVNFALQAGSAVATLGMTNAMQNIALGNSASAYNKSLASGNGTNNVALGLAQNQEQFSAAKSASMEISSGQDLFGSGMSLYQASVETHSAGNSNSSDFLQYHPTNMMLNIVEVYPTLEQARICDDFLDMYGYARNEILSLSSVISNRSNWNYVKTVNCNLSCNCATNYEMALRTIFNNGVTIWHGFDKLISGYNNSDTDNKNT